MSFFKNLFSSKKEEFSEPQIIFEEDSPSCPITAIVEQDKRVVYFYLVPQDANSHIQLKSCWVRNLKAAPKKKEVKLMEKGIAPMMPIRFCKYPEGQEALNPNDLYVVWTEEGNGVALFENDFAIALIPEWSGYKGFCGYSRDAVGEGAFAYELKTNNAFLIKIELGKRFHSKWDKKPNPWVLLQPKLLELYDDVFGKSDKYFAIDGNKWPPKGLYLRSGEEKKVFLTVGMSLRPMPLVEMYLDESKENKRIELGVILNNDTEMKEADVNTIASWISAHANLPWDNITFLTDGHTINFDAFQNIKGAELFNSVILTSRLIKLPKIDVSNVNNELFKLLWMIPITKNERQYAMNKGSEKLIKALDELGDDIFSLKRKEIEF